MARRTVAALAPGKTIADCGTVIVEDYRALGSTPGRAAAGVVSRVVIGYHDTNGNLIQIKEEEVPAGEWFEVHDHPDMHEVFTHRGGGTVTFTHFMPGEDPQETTLTFGGVIMFAPGEMHGASNNSDRTARVTITATRAGNVAPQDVAKGNNIPIAA